jgi:hypothetical protein
MLPAVPSADTAITALRDLRGQIAARAAVRTTEPLEHDDALRLTAELHDLHQIVAWCRDASLGLSRTARPRVTWRELQAATGLPSSTLDSRYDAWKRGEWR